MARSRPLLSDGPDPVVGGPKCIAHHAGVTTGVEDWCCCCNPCLYDRPISLENPCRCVPKLLCFVFRGDDGTRPCCKEFVVHAFANHRGVMTSYSGTFSGGPDISLSIGSDIRDPSTTLASGSDGNPAFWKLHSTALGINETYRIDGSVTTCLAPPAISIAGVTIDTPSGPCVGTVTLELYKSVKLPFTRIDREPYGINKDIAIPPRTDPLCKCDFAVDVLCVWGRRVHNGPLEGVHFVWDEALNDRWTYSPPCGGLLSQEHIYLRGDADGNCYLELDFVQSGDTTNDWGVPQNSFDGNNPHDIRPGMLPIDSCVCGLFVSDYKGQLDDNRYVVITGGYCGRYEYSHCDKCRCVPEKLCVVGSIDGQMFQGQLTWDGEKWATAGTAYISPFSLILEKGDCSGLPLGRPDPATCGLRADGTFLVPFRKGIVTECGPRFAFDLTSDPDPAHPGVYNWMFGRGSLCGGCKDMSCGPCLTRCGGPPQVLYADLEAIISRGHYPYDDPTLPPVMDPDELCAIQVRMEYYQKWLGRSLVCGYIGTAPLPDGGTFIFEWKIRQPDSFEMTRISTTGVKTTLLGLAFDFPYQVCEPFEWISTWQTVLYDGRLCFWGPEIEDHPIIAISKSRLTLTE